MTSLCDRVLLGTETEPTKGQLCSWATIGIGAAIAAGLGGVAANIKSLVDGVYPWEDPLDFLKANAIGAGTGAVTGALTAGAGQALGPILSGAGEALGIGANTGTVAAQAGAATPQGLGGVVSQTGGKLLSSVGENATQAAIDQGIEQIGTSFTDQAFGKALKELPGNVLTGAATGAAKDPDDPLRGVLSGAAGGLASSAINVGAGALMRGQTAGMWNSTPVKDVEFTRYNPDAPAYSLARSELLAPKPAWGMQVTTQQPGLGGRFVGGVAGLGGRATGGVASTGVRSALTPQPHVPQENPYAMWGNPYLTRYNA